MDPLLESNAPELPEPEPAPAPVAARSVESIWPPHTCGKSESAAAISACACGAAMGMLVLYGLCNFE